ncbi:hypothetical protein LZ32DRAFT_623216, partial [Colletotrichum eremochloae]
PSYYNIKGIKILLPLSPKGYILYYLRLLSIEPLSYLFRVNIAINKLLIVIYPTRSISIAYKSILYTKVTLNNYLKLVIKPKNIIYYKLEILKITLKPFSFIKSPFRPFPYRDALLYSLKRFLYKLLLKGSLPSYKVSYLIVLLEIATIKGKSKKRKNKDNYGIIRIRRANLSNKGKGILVARFRDKYITFIKELNKLKYTTKLLYRKYSRRVIRLRGDKKAN